MLSKKVETGNSLVYISNIYGIDKSCFGRVEKNKIFSETYSFGSATRKSNLPHLLFALLQSAGQIASSTSFKRDFIAFQSDSF